MPKLTFNAADVRRVVEHSLKAPKQGQQLTDYTDDGPVYSDVEAPAVILVHDQGVYLMSNGEPADPLDGEGEGKYFRRYVAYAKGCDPKKDADWYDTARDLVGGDDFGEHLPWAERIKQLLDLKPSAKTIAIKMTKNTVELVD